MFPFPSFVPANAPALVSLAYVTHVSSTTNAISWPGGIQSGDVAFLFDCGQGITAPSEVVPGGFTKFAGGTSDGIRSVSSYKILTGSESGSITGMDGSSNDVKMLVIFRANIPISTLTIVALKEQYTGNSPSPQTVNPSAEIVPVVVIGCIGSHSGPADYQFTTSPAFDAELTATGSRMIVGHTIYNSSPVSHNIDANDGGTNAAVAFYFKAT